VIVDGVNTGKLTPTNISVADGDHIVTVQIPGSGWNPDTRTVTIVPGNNDLSVTLLPTPTPGPPGPKGDKGDQGIQGVRGIQGIPGSTTHPDPPCFDNTNRYVDCGNGTVTDTVTGLIWLKQSNCLPNTIWAVANQAAAGLKDGDCALTDHSSPGDWRLPTRDEWSATIARAAALACTTFGSYPSLTNDAGTNCLQVGPSSFADVAPADYWSSSSDEIDPRYAWYGTLAPGLVIRAVKTLTVHFGVWPVRGGPR
jgi:Protein of unknown function (DUF1566)/PEGA domain